MYKRQSFAFGAGEVDTGGADLIFGPRNPAADNYNPNAVYDDGTEILSFDPDPYKDGALSPQNQWRWDGDNAEWNSLEGAPVYSYSTIVEPYYATTAGGWASYETAIEIPEDWNLSAPWFLKINGHNFREIPNALKKAQKSKKPIAISCKTTIGYGSPNKGGKASSHGSPLGEDEIKLVRKKL